MSTAAALYTPDVLALATSLAAYPYDDAAPFKGEARAPACGSTLALSLATDDAGLITAVGLRSHACAIGQAAAAIFARGAVGRSRDDLLATLARIEAWQHGTGDRPDWPGIAAIAAARDYPARHGAMILPWKAAIAALSSTAADR